MDVGLDHDVRRFDDIPKPGFTVRGPVMRFQDLEATLPQPAPGVPESWAKWEITDFHVDHRLKRGPKLAWTRSTAGANSSIGEQCLGIVIFLDRWGRGFPSHRSLLEGTLLLQVSSFSAADGPIDACTTWCLILKPAYTLSNGGTLYQRVGVAKIFDEDVGSQHVWTYTEKPWLEEGNSGDY